MKRIAYVDLVGGGAGDMLLAAFLDAGLDRVALEAALRGLVPDGWTFEPQRVVRRGIAATYAGLHVPGEDGDEDHAHDQHLGQGHGRHLADVLAILERSRLPARAKTRAATIYRRLADAEARVHGTTADAIHFHEVGTIDAILDVAASCVALELLEIDELRVSSFPTGNGTIRMAHGTYPNPPPATVELLHGFALRSVDFPAELVTVTAAAILSTLATPGGPDLVLERTGYGAGRNDFPFPNVTRILIGRAVEAGKLDGVDAEDAVEVIEANIDDLSPQHYELAMERVFAAGALDVWLTPIVMKKGRPALTFSAMAPPAQRDAVAAAILRETSTIGVRTRREARIVAAREISVVATPYGPVRVKRVDIDGESRRRPEYDDLVRIARETGATLAVVTAAVERACEETVAS